VEGRVACGREFYELGARLGRAGAVAIGWAGGDYAAALAQCAAGGAMLMAELYAAKGYFDR